MRQTYSKGGQGSVRNERNQHDKTKAKPKPKPKPKPKTMGYPAHADLVHKPTQGDPRIVLEVLERSENLGTEVEVEGKGRG